MLGRIAVVSGDDHDRYVSKYRSAIPVVSFFVDMARHIP